MECALHLPSRIDSHQSRIFFKNQLWDIIYKQQNAHIWCEHFNEEWKMCTSVNPPPYLWCGKFPLPQRFPRAPSHSIPTFVSSPKQPLSVTISQFFLWLCTYPWCYTFVPDIFSSPLIHVVLYISDVFPCNCWVIVYWRAVPWHRLTCGRIFDLFPAFGNCSPSCHERLCTRLWVDSQERNCWITW